MAQIVVRKFSCDRCKKPYNEIETDGEADKAADGPKVIFIAESHIPNEKAKVMPETVKFKDLCPKCSGRVLDLLAQIRLDKGVEDEKNAESKDGATDKGTTTQTTIPEATARPDDKKADKARSDAGKRAGGSAEPQTH